MTELVDTEGSIVAHSECDSYGNLITTEGTEAHSNPSRFSTKYLDAEVELYYYGYRFYSPTLGRWINRDPIGEHDFASLPIAILNTSERASFEMILLEIGLAHPRLIAVVHAFLFSTSSTTDEERNLYAYVNNRAVMLYDIAGLFCGPGDFGDFLVFDAPFGFDFEGCCKEHDVCYGTCDPKGQHSKSACDDAFLDCMMGKVNELKKWYKPGFLGKALARVYHWAVKYGGCLSFRIAQKKCDCPSKCDRGDLLKTVLFNTGIASVAAALFVSCGGGGGRVYPPGVAVNKIGLAKIPWETNYETGIKSAFRFPDYEEFVKLRSQQVALYGIEYEGIRHQGKVFEFTLGKKKIPVCL